MSKRKIEIEHSEEHQGVNELFSEIYEMKFVDKKAKFEWSMYLYLQVVILVVVLLLNLFFQNIMTYTLVGAIVGFLVCYYLNLNKRRKMLKQKRIVKVRLTNKERGIEGYMTIKPKNAYEIMNEECLIIETSIREYYDEMHIKNAISIPIEELSDKIDAMNLDVNMPILVYSRGSERCKEGSQILVDKGFQEVYNIGTIMEWPYDVVLAEDDE